MQASQKCIKLFQVIFRFIRSIVITEWLLRIYIINRYVSVGYNSIEMLLSLKR